MQRFRSGLSSRTVDSDEERESLSSRPGGSKPQIQRYWPGKAPAWAEAEKAQEEAAALQAAQQRERVRTEVFAPVILVKKTDDPRLQRLARSQRAGDVEEALEQRRRIREPEIVQRRHRGVEDEESRFSSLDAEVKASGKLSEADLRRDRREDGETEENGGRPVGWSSRRVEESEGGRDLKQARERGLEGVRVKREEGVSDEEEDELLPPPPPPPEPAAAGVDRFDRLRREAAVKREEEDDALRRRQAVKERLLQQQVEAERLKARQRQEEEEEESEDEESSSEYESDSEDGGPLGGHVLKPVFVPRGNRETLAEKVDYDEEDRRLEEREKKRREERRVVTKQLVAVSVAQEEAAAAAAAAALDSMFGDPLEIDTDDDADRDAAFTSWRERELRRIKRDREEREAVDREQEERRRLRSMTDEERAAWERANPKVVREKQKEKWKFLQKYWHRGAFFQEDPDDTTGTVGRQDVLDRDYAGATGEDIFDKSLLPKIMQVKNFGRSGRTKWTHLLNEDTTQPQLHTQQASAAPYQQPPLGAVGPPLGDDIRQRLQRKRQEEAAAKEAFSKPKKFKT